MADNTITARLGLDTSEFQQGLTRAQSKAISTGRMIQQGVAQGAEEEEDSGGGLGNILSKVGKKAGNKLFKGLLTGIGIGELGHLEDLITKPWKDAADEAERLAVAAEKAADAVDKRTRAQRTDEQQISVLQKRLDEASGAYNADARLLEAYRNGGADKEGDIQHPFFLETQQRNNDRAQHIGEIQDELSKLTKERDKKAAKSAAELDSAINKQRLDDLKKNIEEGNKIYLDGLKKDEEEKKKSIKAQADMDEEAAKQRRSDLQKQVEEGNRIYLDAQKALEKYDKKRDEFADTQKSRYSGSFDDVAAGRSGSKADQLKAQKIIQLETRARSAYAQGDTSERDQFGKLITNSSEERAKGYLSEADKLRRELETRVPGSDIVKAATEQLAELKKQTGSLAEIQESLTVVSPPNTKQ